MQTGAVAFAVNCAILMSKMHKDFFLVVLGMAGAIHFLSDISVPETSQFPAFELGPQRRENKMEQDS